MSNNSSLLLRRHFAVLAAALFIMIAARAEADSVDISPKQAKGELTLESATALLKPPNTASPQATLASFIENMDRAYSELMKAHRQNLQTPGFFTSKAVKQMAQQAEEYFQSGVECLDLSAVPENLKKSMGYEGAIMLKEIFDRIELPPYSSIPDEKAIDEEEDKDKKADLVRWRIPNTDIIIDIVEEGPREGEYLFTPETVARLEEFYNKIKDYPYKLDARVSQDFYDFYATSAGRFLPPKWNSWLPAWTVQTYLDQTLWQWCTLIILPMGVLLLVWRLVQWWYQRTADLSSGKKTGGWIFILLTTLTLVSLVNYVLDVHVNITGAVRVFLDNTLQKIFIVFLAGLILWEFIKAQIRERTEGEDTIQDDHAEEGGAGGSRGETLLLLLRKTIVFVMFLTVILLLLASMGINVGPLLAGAGVVGLAIGFGAQTLVKDIIAGIFYLIDDAFRVGDYIETSGLKGTVEHISLRSLRLRSPRGPVHTIPFGNMGTVTNNSRDYIISKLEFRVRYDTDIDKVRKIIKKINKKIMKHDTMGPVMLGKIKSQGVRELDDSAMVMRVKFKTIPGEQFVIRREVFRMMQEAFSENGIEFAHRNVTVYLPPENGKIPSKNGGSRIDKNAPDRKVQAAGAAAVAIVQEEAESKAPKST